LRLLMIPCFVLFFQTSTCKSVERVIQANVPNAPSTRDVPKSPVKLDKGASHSPPPSSTLQNPTADRGHPIALTGDQCSTVETGDRNVGPACVTRDISCGETIVSHTVGGGSHFDTKFYEAATCWPGTRNHNGGDERLYRFVVNKSDFGGQRFRATLSFDSPCANLDVSWMRTLGNRVTCPSLDDMKACDMLNTAKLGAADNSRAVVGITMDPGEVYYFLVEGPDEQEGAFALSLDCGT
jgi:hypothetical protein